MVNLDADKDDAEDDAEDNAKKIVEPLTVDDLAAYRTASFEVINPDIIAAVNAGLGAQASASTVSSSNADAEVSRAENGEADARQAAAETKTGAVEGTGRTAAEGAARLAEKPQRSVVERKMTMQESFIALREHLVMRRALTSRQNEYLELLATLDEDRKIHVDNLDILATFDEKQEELSSRLEESTTTSEQADSTLSGLRNEYDFTDAALNRMREQHLKEMEPLTTRLEDAHGKTMKLREEVVEQEQSFQADYGIAGVAVHSVLNGAAPSRSERDVREKELSFARELLSDAEALETEVQAAYDLKKQSLEAKEAPLVERIGELQEQISEQRAVIAAHSEIIGEARERLEYCKHVHDFPDETTQLGERIVAREAVVDDIESDIDRMEQQLAQLKADARNARFLLYGILIAVVVILVVCLAVGLG